ncbi:carbohydrate kinase family protein [Microbacterium elymi]|uniref:Carbohydrate kinase family protein n=1 Tax=Microbacterium elymi TaxID=2909587 RepID=A0ABY5NH12_9MICO|nr:carbohydrate kinase family protein [Microbacterium elymi]UUT34386.1 carbohydrate kinase family protein [Microbacterium elymi]
MTVFIAGPASWNRIVLLDRLPDPVPHMQFALAEHETVGGTSAGKALGLAALGRRPVLHTLLGEDAEAARIAEALRGAGVELITGAADATERHLNLMTPAGERVSLYLSAPGEASAASRARTAAAVTAAMADAAAIVLDLAAEARRLIPEARRTGRPIWTDVHDYDGTAEFARPFVAASRRRVHERGRHRRPPAVPAYRGRPRGVACRVHARRGRRGRGGCGRARAPCRRRPGRGGRRQRRR